MTERQVIMDASVGLGVSQTENIVCPFCKEDHQEQGRPYDWRPNRSCSVTKEQYGVLYHCFRAGCHRGRGFIPSISYEKPTKKEFIPNEYKHNTRNLQPTEAAYLMARFGFTDDIILEHGIRYNPDRGSYIFPIRDVRGYDVGLVDRDFSGRRSAKALTYWFNDVPKLHFIPKNNEGAELSTVLIVEDIPSAIKASRYISVAALLGSSINASQCSVLSTRYHKVILALDNDAFDKALKLQKKFSFYFNEFKVLYLTKDIKDMKEEDIKELLSQ